MVVIIEEIRFAQGATGEGSWQGKIRKKLPAVLFGLDRPAPSVIRIVIKRPFDQFLDQRQIIHDVYNYRPTILRHDRRQPRPVFGRDAEHDEFHARRRRH